MSRKFKKVESQTVKVKRFLVLLLGCSLFVSSTEISDFLKLQPVMAQEQSFHDKKNEALKLYEEGVQQYQNSRFQEALETLNQALIVAQEINQSEIEKNTLYYLGLTINSLEQYPKALEFYQQALTLARNLGDTEIEIKSLNSIGQVYSSLGQYTQALESHETGLMIARETDNRRGVATSLNGIGQVYSSLGQYTKALEFYNLSLAISNNIDDQKELANSLNGMGQVYGILGQYAQALDYHQQALKIAQDMGDQAYESTFLNKIGAIYHSQGDYINALEHYQQALKISQNLSDQIDQGTSLNNIGAVYYEMGQYTQALEYFQSALRIDREIGNKYGETTSLSNLGELYRRLKQDSQALDQYQQALIIARDIDDKVGEEVYLHNIGQIYYSLGEYAQAETYLLESINLQESWKISLNDQQKILFFETQASKYELLQSILIAQNKIESALEISERGRARAFLELLTQKFSETPLDLQVPTLQQIKKVATDQNATLVQYSIIREQVVVEEKPQWKESQLYIWVIQPTGEVIFRTADLKALWQHHNMSLSDFVMTIRERMGVRSLGVVARPNIEKLITLEQSLKSLHQLLIEPISDVLPNDPNERVIFIPQSELFLVSFAGLQDETGSYLIDRHTILTAPSIRTLELTRQQRKTSQEFEDKRRKQDFLVVGNPQMPTVSIPTGSPPQLLSSLPGAETEAQAIATLFNTQPLMGNQATETIVKHQMSTAKFIHLATHGIIEDLGLGIPGAIALTPSGKDDGLLTAGEIFDLSLKAELVVLSACNTGQGEITGDGVIGLSRSFISAGTPSILVSLWAVPDSPTAELMTQFYQNLQTQPDKAQALRQAMLTTKQKHPNPVDWAAFTLIGEAE